MTLREEGDNRVQVTPEVRMKIYLNLVHFFLISILQTIELYFYGGLTIQGILYNGLLLTININHYSTKRNDPKIRNQ